MTVAEQFARNTGRAIRKPVVLVVDDDDFQLKIIELILGFERYDLHFLSSAEHALLWLTTTRADLAMVDLQMPGIDGLELVRRMKASPVLAHIPVLMMSGQADSALVARCLEAGAQDLVHKPFVRDGLQAKVAQALGMEAPVAPAAVAHPGINVARGLSVWGTVQDYCLFLNKFTTTYADSVDRLRDCYAQRDTTAARALAHKMRGAAATMALDELAQCAGVLEMLAEDEDPSASLQKLHEALNTALASITRFTVDKAG